MGGLLKDIRYSLRTLISNPGFTLTALLVLALGIAANSTIFSWINSTLLDPIPGAPDTRDMVTVSRGEWTSSPFPPFSYEDFRDLRARTTSFSGMLGYHDLAVSVTGAARPERILGTLASPNYFEVLGIKPLLGRAFRQEEGEKPGTAAVAVISYGLWHSQFAGDRSILGQNIEINNRPYTVIGVAPASFHGCKTGVRSDIWIPFTMDPAITGWRRIAFRNTCWLNVLARLKPGVSSQTAQAEMNLKMREIVSQFPEAHQGPNQITLDPLWRSRYGMGYSLYIGFSMLWGLAAVLLLLSCANVGNLLLVHGVARRRELAIRLSLGATRLQLARQFVAESLLLGLGAGAAAVIATAWTAGLLSALIPTVAVPLELPGRVDTRVLVVTLLIAVLSSILVGLLPALRSSRLAPAKMLKEEGTSVSAALHKSRLARGLVVAQVALSFLLMVCAGLFIRSYHNALQTDPGFDPNHLLLASYDLQSVGYSTAQGMAFDRQLISRLEALPGVQSVTLANSVPLFGGGHSQDIAPQGYVPRRDESMEVARINVGPNYFRTMKIPLVSGRDIALEDGPKSQPVVVVNESLARRYWPGQEPIGKRLKAYGRWFTVVGVAKNAKFQELKGETAPMIFLPLFQVYYQDPTIHLRVAGDPYGYLEPVKRTVAELNGDLALFEITSLSAVAETGTARERLGGTLVGILASLALILSAVGIYGIIAYTTRQRTHEVGIRLALGAQPSLIRRLILSEGMVLTLIGLTIGIVATVFVTRLLTNFFFGVTPTDIVTYLAVTFVLLFVGVIACYIPARRASRVSPQLALRDQC